MADALLPLRLAAPALLLMLATVCLACQPTPPTVDPAYPPSPLSPCPGTPNCVRSSRAFDAGASALFQQARDALTSMHPASVEVPSDSTHRLKAVFRVFFFKDDFDLAVLPHADGAVLYLRSASRVGQGDLGVNARRVKRFWKALQRQQQRP